MLVALDFNMFSLRFQRFFLLLPLLLLRLLKQDWLHWTHTQRTHTEANICCAVFLCSARIVFAYLPQCCVAKKRRATEFNLLVMYEADATRLNEGVVVQPVRLG